jgi:hypothetical protein
MRFGALLLLLPVSVILVSISSTQTYRAAQGTRSAAPFHRFRDWSTRYAIYTHSGTLSALNAVSRDPRAQFAWRDWEKAHSRTADAVGGTQTMGRDWSVSLGGGTTAPDQFPVVFSAGNTPDCTNDFVVFPVDVAGSGAQPNIVAFNDLYSGSNPVAGNGPCNRTSSASDIGTDPRVLWSYNVSAIAGAVLTSPVTSRDGTKVAFVESLGTTAAHFHVLAWTSGQGQNPANLQDVTKPQEITAFASTTPAPGSGTATDLALGTSDTISSPFIDYTTDQAYVGDDAGTLYRINNVFCPQGGCAAPSLDPTWGTGGKVAVGCGSTLTGPVIDFVTGHVFVGCANGVLYGFNSNGTPLPFGPVAVGNGSSNREGNVGGIVDPPIVDGVDSLVYAVSGTGAAPHTGNAVVVQTSTLLRGGSVATVGTGSTFPAHAPDFNNNFFSGASASTWALYMGGFNATAHPRIFGITFSSSLAGGMTAGTPAHALAIPNNGAFAPFTEFLNGATDLLFFGNIFTGGKFNVGALPISGFPPPRGFPRAPTAAATEGGGPSGIVIDNDTSVAQTANIYFGAQPCGTGCTTGNAAVKLTQIGLH